MTGNWSTSKAIIKASLTLVPLGTGKAFEALGVPVANALVEVAGMGADAGFNEMRKTKTGPYRQ